MPTQTTIAANGHPNVALGIAFALARFGCAAVFRDSCRIA